MTIDLKKFCEDDDAVRWYLTEPFSEGEYTYATNGHIIVRVPKCVDTQPHEHMAGRGPKIFADNPCGELMDIPDLPNPETMKCTECEHGCAECDNGWLVKPQRIDLGDSHFQAHYLRLVKSLPNAKISPNGPMNPAPFVFDGGEGLLMPCKPF